MTRYPHENVKANEGCRKVDNVIKAICQLGQSNSLIDILPSALLDILDVIENTGQTMAQTLENLDFSRDKTKYHQYGREQ